MVTVMMKLPVQGFARHYNDMTEVCNCGGGHRTRLRQILSSFGVLTSPEYKGGREEVAGLGGAPIIGSPTRTPKS